MRRASLRYFMNIRVLCWDRRRGRYELAFRRPFWLLGDGDGVVVLSMFVDGHEEGNLKDCDLKICVVRVTWRLVKLSECKILALVWRMQEFLKRQLQLLLVIFMIHGHCFVFRIVISLWLYGNIDIVLQDSRAMALMQFQKHVPPRSFELGSLFQPRWLVVRNYQVIW